MDFPRVADIQKSAETTKKEGKYKKGKTLHKLAVTM